MVEKRILLVEGRDDREVLYQFCNHVGIDNRTRFTVQEKDGIASLLADLTIRPRSGVDVLGVVVDADLDLGARWQSLRQAASATGYTLPPEPAAGGTIVPPPAPGRPRLGVWLMPDNQIPGGLEDFLLLLADPTDALVPHARSVVTGLSPADRRFSPNKESKAVLHTWLAWQEEPGTALGLAITRRYLHPTRAAAARAFETWLTTLFPAPP